MTSLLGKKKFGYGVISHQHIKQCAVAVCEVFGRRPYDLAQMLETCEVETRLGEYLDKSPYRLGVSVMQIDEIAFDHIQQKYQTSEIAERLKAAFGVDMEQVTYRELAINPLLAMVFARFQYWQVTESIPASMVERATYWKEHYNTDAGEGTEQDYIQAVSKGYSTALAQEL